jgi:hypothetical protein
MTKYSDIHNTKRKQDLYAKLCNTFVKKKSPINMGIKIHNLPSALKIENFKIFKNKFKKLFITKLFFFSTSFLVIMTDSSLVIRVKFRYYTEVNGWSLGC